MVELWWKGQKTEGHEPSIWRVIKGLIAVYFRNRYRDELVKLFMVIRKKSELDAINLQLVDKLLPNSEENRIVLFKITNEWSIKTSGKGEFTALGMTVSVKEKQMTAQSNVDRLF